MKQMFVVLVVLACLLGSVQQAPAAGILEGICSFLFGSQPKVVQFFSPFVEGELSARDPASLSEVTFPLPDGSGGRTHLVEGLPTPRGVILMGKLAIATGGREVDAQIWADADPQGMIKVPNLRDGHWVNEAREIVSSIPRELTGHAMGLPWYRAAASLSRGEWSESAAALVALRSYQCRQEAARQTILRGGKVEHFAVGFVTESAPFVFALETTRMMDQGGSVSIQVRQKGRGGLEGSARLDYRVVQTTDLEGRPVVSEYQQTAAETLGFQPFAGGVPQAIEASGGCAEQDYGSVGSPDTSFQFGDRNVSQAAIRTAANWGYRCRPMDWDRKAQYRWTGDGDAPVIIFVTDGAPHTIEIEWGGARRQLQTTAAGFAVDRLPQGTVFVPVIDGERAGRFMAGGLGFWVPCTKGPEGWYVKN